MENLMKNSILPFNLDWAFFPHLATLPTARSEGVLDSAAYTYQYHHSEESKM